MANQQKSSSLSLSFSNQPLYKGVNGTPIGGGVTGGKKACKTRKTRSIWYSQGALPWLCRRSPNPALLTHDKPGPRTLRGSLPRVPSPSVNERVSHGRDHFFTRYLCADNFQLVVRMGYQGLVFAVRGGHPHPLL